MERSQAKPMLRPVDVFLASIYTVCPQAYNTCIQYYTHIDYITPEYLVNESELKSDIVEVAVYDV